MPLYDFDNSIRVIQYNNQAFETVACMHTISDPTHHIDNKILIERIIGMTPKSVIDKVKEYSSLTYNWTLILDMISGTSKSANESFGETIDTILKLSPVDFSYFIFGGNKVSQERLNDWIQNPKLVFDVDESYFPSYTSANAVFDYLVNMDFYKEMIVKTICDFWQTTFSTFWEAINPYISSSIAKQQHVLATEGIHSFLKNINANITFQDGKFIYSNLEVYPVYNFPFFKDFTELRVFPSLFTAPHSYISHHHNFLVLGQNLIFQEQQYEDYLANDLLMVFKALSDETRLKIIFLINKSPMTTKMLSDRLKLSMGNISKHLQILKNCDIVFTQKNKQEVFYSLKKDTIFNIFSLMRSKLF